MMRFKTYFLLLFIVFVGCKNTPKEAPNTVRPSADEAILLNRQVPVTKVSEVIKWKSAIQSVLAQKLPILKLEEIADPHLAFAQEVAIQNKAFVSQCRLKNGDPILSTITDVRMASKRELKLAKLSQELVLVEMYNYYYNTVVNAFIDKASQKIVKVVRYPGEHPKLRKELKILAPKIALSYEEILKQLPGDLAKYEVAIRDSKCERSRHLCSAVLLTKKGGDKTLWVLIDLTTLTAIGYQWLPLWDPNRPQLVTERSLQNEVVVSTYCGDTLSQKLGKWEVNYTLTNSDGIEIFDVRFNNIKVLNSAKLVDWHVSYPNKKDFGYSDAMGCPKFSSAAVVAFGGPDIQRITKNGQEVGYSFVQDFRSPVWPKGCNYRYQNLFEFYDDGRFRIAGVNLGLGCSTNGWYRPIFRIDLANEGESNISKWGGTDWEIWTKEQWHLQGKKTTFSPQGYLFRIKNKKGIGYFLEPNQGQFEDGSKGDDAFTYVSVKHPEKDEGTSDMRTLGDCCNTDFRQGPEQFIQPSEPLTGHSIIWYVPQMQNNATKGSQYCWVESYAKEGYEAYHTYPGVVGPMFVPIKK